MPETLKDFAAGDKVIHPVCGEGVVESRSDDAITVLFADFKGTGPLRGVYDADWFRIGTFRGWWLAHKSA